MAEAWGAERENHRLSHPTKGASILGSFKHLYTLIHLVLTTTSFYKWGNWGTERLNHLSKGTLRTRDSKYIALSKFKKVPPHLLKGTVSSLLRSLTWRLMSQWWELRLRFYPHLQPWLQSLCAGQNLTAAGGSPGHTGLLEPKFTWGVEHQNHPLTQHTSTVIPSSYTCKGVGHT